MVLFSDITVKTPISAKFLLERGLPYSASTSHNVIAIARNINARHTGRTPVKTTGFVSITPL